jgi:hypothetical protein
MAWTGISVLVWLGNDAVTEEFPTSLRIWLEIPR